MSTRYLPKQVFVGCLSMLWSLFVFSWTTVIAKSVPPKRITLDKDYEVPSPISRGNTITLRAGEASFYYYGNKDSLSPKEMIEQGTLATGTLAQEEYFDGIVVPAGTIVHFSERARYSPNFYLQLKKPMRYGGILFEGLLNFKLFEEEPRIPEDCEKEKGPKPELRKDGHITLEGTLADDIFLDGFWLAAHQPVELEGPLYAVSAHSNKELHLLKGVIARNQSYNDSKILLQKGDIISSNIHNVSPLYRLSSQYGPTIDVLFSTSRLVEGQYPVVGFNSDHDFSYRKPSEYAVTYSLVTGKLLRITTTPHQQYQPIAGLFADKDKPIFFYPTGELHAFWLPKDKVQSFQKWTLGHPEHDFHQVSFWKNGNLQYAPVNDENLLRLIDSAGIKASLLLKYGKKDLDGPFMLWDKAGKPRLLLFTSWFYPDKSHPSIGETHEHVYEIHERSGQWAFHPIGKNHPLYSKLASVKGGPILPWNWFHFKEITTWLENEP